MIKSIAPRQKRESEIEKLARMVKNGFDDVIERIDKLSGSVDRRFDAVEVRFKGMDDRFDRIEHRLDGMGDFIRDHERRITALESKA